MSGQPWIHADLAILKRRYPNMQTAELARELGRSVSATYNRAFGMGLRKSDAFMASERSGRIARGRQHPNMIAHQFPKGHVPANKGLCRPGWAPGRMAQTQFKKGQLSGLAAENLLPIGAERVGKDGILQRKVNNDMPSQRRWKSVHTIVWQENNGAVPRGFIVVFRPGKKTTVAAEITPDRLELISRAENMRRNSYLARYPKEVADVIRMRGALNRKINNRSRQA